MKVFLLLISILASFIHAMEKDLSFNEPLAKFLVQVYSMPTWKKSELENIKNQIPYLINSRKLVVEEGLAIDLDRINMGTYSKLIQSAKNLAIEKIQAIYSGVLPFQFVYDIHQFLVKNEVTNGVTANAVCQSLSDDISAKVKEGEVKEQHKLTIQALLTKSGVNIKHIEENKFSGVNVGFIVTDENNCRYFVKTFNDGFNSPSAKTKKIDCREVFAYKVLEYLGFGPETYCLIQQFSSSQRSATKGDYIATKDVAVIDKEGELKKEFFRDDDESKVLDYDQALKNKDFLAELFSIASLNSILRLYDTFGDNTGNYGIIKTTMSNESVKYEPVLVDHLPCTSNGIIDESYSPGNFLKNKLDTKSGKDSNLQKVIKEGLSSRNSKLTEEVKSMVSKGKKKITFEDSINKASEYVLQLIKENSNSFTDEEKENGDVISAQDMLTKHVKVVMQNYTLFQRITLLS
jgi:hypothetical protein